MKQYYVYIMTNKSGMLYTGVTNNLLRRVYEHKQKLVSGITKKFRITKLVYFELSSDVMAAINREQEIKDWRRAKKIALVNTVNPAWKDLSAEWYENSKFKQKKTFPFVISNACPERSRGKVRNLGRVERRPSPAQPGFLAALEMTCSCCHFEPRFRGEESGLRMGLRLCEGIKVSYLADK